MLSGVLIRRARRADVPGIITLFTAVAAERDKPSGDWDAVTLAVSLVTARCWGPPNEKIVVEVQNPLGPDRRAGVAVCGVVANDTSRRGVARGVLHEVETKSAERGLIDQGLEASTSRIIGPE
jgi:hypothetical protein